MTRHEIVEVNPLNAQLLADFKFLSVTTDHGDARALFLQHLGDEQAQSPRTDHRDPRSRVHSALRGHLIRGGERLDEHRLLVGYVVGNLVQVVFRRNQIVGEAPVAGDDAHHPA